MNIQAGVFWIVLTVFCEARNQTPKGQKDVVKVIINRANKNNWDVSNVVLARKQFSCFNNGLMGAFQQIPNELQYIASVTRNVLEGINEWMCGNDLKGATHYYNPKLTNNGKGGFPNTWKKEKMKILFQEKDHIFLTEI